ncbi:MAG: serine hydrolase domain-containing protein [Jatrophihabitans sp.]
MTLLGTPLNSPLLRRVHVPHDLDAVTCVGPEDDPESAGLDARTVERIWAAAVDLYRTGGHPAVQLCLRHRGRVVVNRSIGHAKGNGPGERDPDAQVLATTDTPFCVYSASKAWTATIALMLVEQGVFTLDDLVADFIPGYGRHGKGRTTIAHVLTHRAGVPYLPAVNADLDRLDDREFIRDTLSNMRPLGPPGTRLAYHALTAGHLMGEIVQAATGQGIRDVLEQQLLRPLGFRWSDYGVAPSDVDAVGLSSFTGLPILPPVSTQLERTLSGSLEHAVESSNDPRFLTAVVPSANVVTTAFEMSRFYELLRRGGELDGVRVLTPDTLRLALTQTAHLEPDRVLGWFPVRYGIGYMLGARYLSLYGQDTEGAFGHLGLSSVVGWADPRRVLAGGLITTGKALLYPGMDRFLRLMNRIAARVPKVNPAELLF